nr:mannose-1-phosphate guanylyltransferase/mannose-6-phosphate isomerase [uncultured Tolumonas sp.]
MVLCPIIMAGGNGSRLWPLSRVLYPKQFLVLDGDATMLQQTVHRLASLPCTAPMVICNEEHRFLVAEQLRKIDKLSNNIILEPVGRNTAPAVALAAFSAVQNGDDPLLLVLAADHIIKNEQAFRQAIECAIPLAEKNHLVTFGIVPQAPETGYGYIRRGEAITESSYQVAQFVEKPNLETANAYVASGEFYWNSGMFLFKASQYLSELKKFRADIYQACEQALAQTTPDLNFIRVDKEIFSGCPDDSIDYAVMEKTEAAAVVAMDASWNDVGSWSSLWHVSEKDSKENVHKGDVIAVDSEKNYVYSENALVATVGVKDFVIVQTADAVLVAHRDQVQDVKKVVETIKKLGRQEHYTHRDVYRPWGLLSSIDDGERYAVKRVSVRPGEKLSLQLHHNRAEHWIVVQGTAKVTRGEETFYLTENQSTYLPTGIKHSLENPGKINLELIEVRSGSYLGEDDIIRFEDRYGRV